MKIPKHIDKLIDKRQNLAVKLAEVSTELDEWLMKNDIHLGEEYTCTGCMIYCEPYTAARCVREDIINKE